jgi:two-component system, OmpR family, alkaline phosphatase synthesis response regulator PhoP
LKTILVVDDETDLLDGLKYLLEEEGYHVLLARDGKECLNVLSKYKPDLVLLDVMMPRPNGYEILQIMKNAPETKHIPVVLMSVSRPPEDQSATQWQAFVTKPFIIETLLNTITKSIAKKAA